MTVTNATRLIARAAVLAAVAFSAALLVGCGNSPEKDFQKGKDAQEKGRYDEAVKYYEKAADKDHDEAMFQLGMLYYGGKGVEEDQELGTIYLEGAAEAGNAKAQFFVLTLDPAFQFMSDEQAKIKMKPIEEGLLKLAEAGDTEAMALYGSICLTYGDLAEAQKWAKKVEELDKKKK